MNFTPRSAKDGTDRGGNFLNQDNAESESVLEKARHIAMTVQCHGVSVVAEVFSGVGFAAVHIQLG